MARSCRVRYHSERVASHSPNIVFVLHLDTNVAAVADVAADVADDAVADDAVAVAVEHVFVGGIVASGEIVLYADVAVDSVDVDGGSEEEDVVVDDGRAIRPTTGSWNGMENWGRH